MTEHPITIRRPKDTDGRAIYVDVQYLKIARLAPQHPPCFDSQDDWLEWLALAGASKEKCVRPILGERNPRFNDGVRFCVDCDADYSAKMMGKGRCSPQWCSARLHSLPADVDAAEVLA